MAALRSWRWLLLWLLLSLLLAGVLAWALLDPAPSPLRAWFTPGPMTHGHHQIELACDACHTTAFGGGPVLQEACVDCHGEQLKRVDDSHPKSKFTDPRNADLVKKLDGRLCASCHVEHRPGITGAMGLSLPEDYCITCHADVGTDRPTHAGLGYQTCATAGCHNYHDNRALYEDFLVEHAHAPAMLDAMRLPPRDFAQRWKFEHARAPATQADHADVDPKILREWLESSHAAAGVQCTDCHAPKGATWSDKPTHAACATCHDGEVQGFLSGKHGMRLAAGLTAMQPELARLPMQRDAAHRELSCSSCHGAHGFDTRKAAVEACLGCHADEHSLAFRDSPHAALWQRELAGELPAGSGVSCASCHLPREVGGEGEGVRVQHNQNANLQPNEAMVRPVCQHCHGLGFALDALADPQRVKDNFKLAPKRHVESIDMALKNQAADAARRGTESAP